MPGPSHDLELESDSIRREHKRKGLHLPSPSYEHILRHYIGWKSLWVNPHYIPCPFRYVLQRSKDRHLFCPTHHGDIQHLCLWWSYRIIIQEGKYLETEQFLIALYGIIDHLWFTLSHNNMFVFSSIQVMVRFEDFHMGKGRQMANQRPSHSNKAILPLLRPLSSCDGWWIVLYSQCRNKSRTLFYTSAKTITSMFWFYCYNEPLKVLIYYFIISQFLYPPVGLLGSQGSLLFQPCINTPDSANQS